MATDIQRCYRGWSDRRFVALIKNKNQAAKRIQQAFRSKKLLMRLKKKVNRSLAAKRIQKAYRDMCVRIKYKKLKARRLRVLLYRQHVFDQKIGDWKRAKAKKFAAVKLQKVYRSWKIEKMEFLRREAETRRRRNSKASLIQHNWRICLIKLKLEKLDKSLKLLQRWHRAKLERLRFLGYRNNRIHNSLEIQRVWRGYQGRKAGTLARHNYMKKKEAQRQKEDIAATRIQKEMRRYIARQRYVDFLAKTSAAIILQRYSRGGMARNRERLKAYSALTIQRYGRGMLGRRRSNSLLQKKLMKKRVLAAIQIQAVVRGALDRKHVAALRDLRNQKAFRKRNNNAILIQSLVRGYIVRSRNKGNVETMKAQKYLASIKIQKLVRGHVVRCRLERSEKKNRQIQFYAAVKIQKIVRGALAREHVRRMQEALLLKLCEEGSDCDSKEQMKLKNDVTEQNLREMNASVKIQSTLRGHMTRKRLLQEKLHDANRHNAALNIQKIVRGKQGRDKATRYAVIRNTNMKIREVAAEDIQRIVRGHLAKLEVADKRLNMQKKERIEREMKAQAKQKLRDERMAEKVARETMHLMDEESRINENRLLKLAEQADKARAERQQDKNRKMIEKRKAAEKAYLRQRLDGMRDALDKANDKESIEAIVFLIPENEGEEFLSLRNEAIEKAKTFSKNAKVADDEWTEAYDEASGHTYYINVNTGETSWTKNSSEGSSGIVVENKTSERSSNIFERVVKRAEASEVASQEAY